MLLTDDVSSVMSSPIALLGWSTASISVWRHPKYRHSWYWLNVELEGPLVMEYVSSEDILLW